MARTCAARRPPDHCDRAAERAARGSSRRREFAPVTVIAGPFPPAATFLSSTATMDVCWQLRCDLLIEEIHPRTGATFSNWQIKQGRIIVEDQMARRTR